jgi:hypothetical protein
MTGHVLVQAWPIRWLKIQLALMSSMNAYDKSLDPAWRNGSVIVDLAKNSTWAQFSHDYVPLPDDGLRVLDRGALAWEFLVPILVLMRLTGPATSCIGAFVHIGMWIHLAAGHFSLHALCYSMPFIPGERRDRHRRVGAMWRPI